MSYVYSMMTRIEDTPDEVMTKLHEMYERIKREIRYHDMSDYIFEFGESAFNRIIDMVYRSSCIDPTAKTIFGIPFIIKSPRFISPDQIHLVSKDRTDYSLYNKVSFGEFNLKEANKVFIEQSVKPMWSSKIKKVIFNNPATIVIWNDKSKTVVKSENEPFDPEKGLAMCIAKKALGNKGNYYDIFRKWLPNE